MPDRDSNFDAGDDRLPRRTIKRLAEARRREAEAGFISDLTQFALFDPDVQPLIGGMRALDYMFSPPDGPYIVRPLCGASGSEPILCDDSDLRYEDRRRILTKQESKILRWAQENLDQSGRNIYIALIAIRVLIGAASPTIRCYRAQINGPVVVPEMPVRMILMTNLGVYRHEVPAWPDIVYALARASGHVNRDVRFFRSFLFRVLIGVLLNIVYAREYASRNAEYDDRSGEVEDRVRGIIETIPERDPAESGAHGQAGRASDGGKRPTPAPRGPRPRPRSPRPRMF